MAKGQMKGNKQGGTPGVDIVGAPPAETGAPRKTTRVEPDPAEMAAQVLTLGDVAKRLHKSPRWLRDYLRGRSIGKMAGRTPIFVEADVAAIFESLPSPNPLP
jgi:hypothetical protein